jgi:hypothetical protein
MLEDVVHLPLTDQLSQPADDPRAQHLVLEDAGDELGFFVVAGHVRVRGLKQPQVFDAWYVLAIF